ncbi:MAG: 16S rRNA (guanine(527)-N(7))-methyltransferase [uncultured Truepera sp.]|uniref:Ribosomal RNA small subunit methyltransferase G n=1 Tax=uncultured Truepera sp. TaxID=543023 RepID=A0A6J4V7C8_9DEIN|nr:MAG: 16S rRNA (guanine(527)-N(7))-methyltransferase [uncultured Truepera sp.]
MKQSSKLSAYKDLIKTYHRTLDLMSGRAVASLDEKVQEAQGYPDFIAPRLSPSDRILDIGSGAGLPGIPLALAFPEQRVTLVERRQRRANFLRIVVGQLGLTNVEVVGTDVQVFQAAPYRWVCAQAVGSFSLLYCLTRHLHGDTVSILSRRSDLSPTEQGALERFTGPILDAESVPLPTHGKLVALRLQGGRPCPLSV